VLEDRTEEAGCAVPPPLIDAGGDEVIGAIVGWGNGVEHLLDSGCSLLFRSDAGWAGAGGELVFAPRIQIRLREFFTMLTTTRWENTKMSKDRTF
jgi:hypothetical protein